MSTYLIILLWAIAGACKAVQDTIDHHFTTSIFDNHKFPDRVFFWWLSKGYKQKLPWFLKDAWHLFGTIRTGAQIGSLVVAIVFSPSLWSAAVILAIYPAIFNLMYRRYLIKKGYRWGFFKALFDWR